MRKLLTLIFLIGNLLPAQVKFQKYFSEGALRLDYYHIGNNKKEFITFEKLVKEPYWGGGKVNLIDTFKYGSYFFEVKEPNSGKTIYSRGYSTLFREWQTTKEAKLEFRTFPESIIFPFPKDSVVVEIFSRNKKGKFKKIFEMGINPENKFIEIQDLKYPVIKVHYSGSSSEKLDIVFLAEGYTIYQMKDFKNDCKRFANYLFSYSPFDTNKTRINIWGVLSPSRQSGSDVPPESVWKNTILNSSYYSLMSERYLMTKDYFKIRDLAASVPYDVICILVNSKKYGGGGIYNYYSIVAAKNRKAKQIFIHEFGHAFGGLADEYYTSKVSYENFYPPGVEPWEPNITTLVDFSRKWKDLLPAGVPVPTPPIKKYAGVVGVFEGGGYVAKGVYRSSLKSIMRSFSSDEFNTVSRKALQKMINFYLK